MTDERMVHFVRNGRYFSGPTMGDPKNQPPASPRAAKQDTARVGVRRLKVEGSTTLAALRKRITFLEGERQQQALLLHLNEILLDHMDPESLFSALSDALRERTHHEFLALTAVDKDQSRERLWLIDSPFLHSRIKIGEEIPQYWGLARKALESKRINLLGPSQIVALQPPELARVVMEKQIRSICQVPLFSRGRPLGILSLGSTVEGHFSGDMLRFLDQVAVQMAVALDNAFAFEDIKSSRDRLAEEKLYLEEEVRRDFATEEIIGNSSALIQVLRQIETVAPADATVLLLGETGTGKELLARAIHERSRRKGRTFVKLNCSAIPLGLVESELFGHERGAFTGAISRKVGRFELAHQGSIFLDEIGDLPLELQPKLLRAIQEREFERLGSTQTQHVDVRLIAATHRNLAQMMEEGTFRSDLYYRLNVFPIKVPALRERKEDIPALVRYFTQKYSKAMDKRIERIPSATMEALVACPWPGNIRELQNVVERSVILSTGAELRVPLNELSLNQDRQAGPAPQTLEDLERQGILAALEACGGVVGGRAGAAARLGLKRTTLNSKMRRLGLGNLS